VAAGSGQGSEIIATSPLHDERVNPSSPSIPHLSPTMSYTMEAQGVVRPTGTQWERQCLQLEEELQRERAEWRQQARAFEDQIRVATSGCLEQDEACKGLRKKLHDEEKSASAARSSGAEALKELAVEAEAAESGSESAARWQQEALECSVELVHAQNKKEEATRRAENASKRASEAERQRRDLAAQAGTKGAQALRSEYDDMRKRMKRMVSRGEKMLAEEARLQQAISEETEYSAAQTRTAKLEKAEADRVREASKNLRRTLQEKLDLTEKELEDARQARHDAQEHLCREQRQRIDEARRHRHLGADRQLFKSEVEELRDQLRWTEAALVQHGLAARSGDRPSLRTKLAAPAKEDVLPATGEALSSRLNNPTRLPAQTRASSYDAAGASRARMAANMADAQVADSPSASQQVVESCNIADNIGASKHSNTAESKEAEADKPPDDGELRAGLNDAGARLMDVIARAKKRADQRRILSGTANEVRVKAKALEKLLFEDVAVS
jgi:DNA repair exonuclease SbcCD ATPase subunit